MCIFGDTREVVTVFKGVFDGTENQDAEWKIWERPLDLAAIKQAIKDAEERADALQEAFESNLQPQQRTLYNRAYYNYAERRDALHSRHMNATMLENGRRGFEAFLDPEQRIALEAVKRAIDAPLNIGNEMDKPPEFGKERSRHYTPQGISPENGLYVEAVFNMAVKEAGLAESQLHLHYDEEDRSFFLSRSEQIAPDTDYVDVLESVTEGVGAVQKHVQSYIRPQQDKGAGIACVKAGNKVACRIVVPHEDENPLVTLAKLFRDHQIQPRAKSGSSIKVTPMKEMPVPAGNRRPDKSFRYTRTQDGQEMVRAAIERDVITVSGDMTNAFLLEFLGARISAA